MTNIEAEAQKLVELVMKQVNERRQQVLDEMIQKGYTNKTHIIVDNLVDVIENPSLPYIVTYQPIIKK
jgi:hypothetical protein